MHANGLQAEPILRHGNPYEQIVNAAEELGVDLIVIGSQGYTGLGRLLLGSTADRVLQYAPCPVLVVKDSVRTPVVSANSESLAQQFAGTH